MNYFCRCSSPTTINDTNLQLYSLEQAANNWNSLVESFTEQGGDIHLKEKIVFIISCLGLSLAQLLGQNSPNHEREKIDDPRKLLSDILSECKIDRNRRRCLNNIFKDFMDYYDSVRHFGKNINEQKYRLVEKLTIQEIDRFRQMTIEIWDIIITKFKKDDNNELNQIMSVTDIVWFQDIAVKEKPQTGQYRI